MAWNNPAPPSLDRCAKAAASPGPGETRGGRRRGGGRRRRRGRREETGPGRFQVPGPVGPQNTKPVRDRQQQPDVSHPGGVRSLHPHALLPLSAVSRRRAGLRRRGQKHFATVGGRNGELRLWKVPTLPNIPQHLRETTVGFLADDPAALLCCDWFIFRNSEALSRKGFFLNLECFSHTCFSSSPVLKYHTFQSGNVRTLASGFLFFAFFLCMPFLVLFHQRIFFFCGKCLVAACSVLPLSHASLNHVVIVAAQRQELPARLLPVPVLFQKLRLLFWLPLQVLPAVQAT